MKARFIRNCEELPERFGKAGSDIDALAAPLQEEGAKSFVDSWNGLLEVIASRGAAIAAAG